MTTWGVTADLDQENRYRVTVGYRYGTIRVDGLIQFKVSGETMPEPPAAPMTYEELIRWQVSLLDQGYRLELGEELY